MGGCRCSYKNCLRATKNSEKDFHFFHYPVRDRERCSKWIANAKKPSFEQLPEDQLRNKVVCQLHFEVQYFTNANRKRLVHDAVPTIDAGSEECSTTTTRTDAPDVQVLQSHLDSNVFTVGTENLMHGEVGDVTSYLIRNGNVIPSDDDDRKLLYKICVSEDIVDTVNFPICETFMPNDRMPSEDLLPNLCFIKRDESELGQDTICETTEASLYEPPVASMYEPQNLMEMIGENIFLNPNQFENPPPKMLNEEIEVPDQNAANTSMEVQNMSRTIQQHSREIASLKRILKSKIKTSRLKKRGAIGKLMNNLRGIIPSTLYGAISLHVSPKHDHFTTDEKDFLLTLYRRSPAAYQALIKDCKWKLPAATIVENLIFEDSFLR